MLRAAPPSESGGSCSGDRLPNKVRRELADAAVALARAANYYNAGTVEFLVDADTYEWFFIEVNPRVQVEHTVTEMVTGIDIVRTQIQVAQGLSLHGEEIGLPAADRTSRCTARRCNAASRPKIRPTTSFRITASIHTYRSPAGFGIRLDGASAYGGAVISPYYDSLLVKVTAWGQNFPQACQRMDRALREFRIRGVKTNIPFLENVVNHPAFQAGETTTTFLDETPELFQFTPRRDRATKLLTYLAEVIVNGNPEVAKSRDPRSFAKPRDSAAACQSGAAKARVSCSIGWDRRALPNGPARRRGCCSPTRHSAMRTNR